MSRIFECYLPKDTEVHVMVPDSAAPCHVDFLLCPGTTISCRGKRLPSDVVQRWHRFNLWRPLLGQPCLPSTCSRVVSGSTSDERRTWEPGARIHLSRFQLALMHKRCSIFVYVASATEILHFVNPSLSWGVVKVIAFGLASQTYVEDL